MGRRQLLFVAGSVALLFAVGAWLFVQRKGGSEAEFGYELEGKSPREVTKLIFDTQGCADCHGFTPTGAFGLNRRGQSLMEGFEGCAAMMNTVLETLSVPEPQWTE